MVQALPWGIGDGLMNIELEQSFILRKCLKEPGKTWGIYPIQAIILLIALTFDLSLN